ncbi:MAG: hypothetical protein HY040_05210 [Planctomycetes bacterium]|nr:hypothetical protein [Planctomycetota bacterium]
MQPEDVSIGMDRDAPGRQFRAALDLRPLTPEEEDVWQAWGRVLAEDVVAPVDVPCFDRSLVDGFAVRAEDTDDAVEDRPRSFTLTGETPALGVAPAKTVDPGFAGRVIRGSMIPPGANAVVAAAEAMVDGNLVSIRRPVTRGTNITAAGAEIARGQRPLNRGDLLGSRETGILAALGIARVQVYPKPRAAILSTGNELIPPGREWSPGMVYDGSATALCDAVRELGGEPVYYGIVPDDEIALQRALWQALACDVILLSCGASKGEGDPASRAAANLGRPGVIVQGTTQDPAKPFCLAAVDVPPRGQPISFPLSRARQDECAVPRGRRVPVVLLAGFPTSAMASFHEFAAPVIRTLAGRSP